MAKGVKVREHPLLEQWVISEILVSGFKSISDEQKLEIRPFTILAGANSSGKSSIMQPLLLLKQTLEAAYDPGPLLLNGPNVKFTSAEQLLSRIGKGRSLDSFRVGVRSPTEDAFVIDYRKESKAGFRIEQMEITGTFGRFNLWPEMTSAEIVRSGIAKATYGSEEAPGFHKSARWRIGRERCFLELHSEEQSPNGFDTFLGSRPGPVWEGIIPQLIHLPGLRGNPERAYPVAAIGRTYPGTFEKYTASVILQWIEEKSDNIVKFNADLQLLKLTGGIGAKRLFDI